MDRTTPQGIRTFQILWLGLVISHVGSQLTGFAMGVWLYQRTGSVSLYSLIVLLTFGPPLLVGPLAGALADRWDRRSLILAAHIGGTATVVALLALAKLDVLTPAAALAGTALLSSFNALELPAFSASIVLLVPREALDRANGLVQIGNGIAQFAAPMAAGFLLPAIGIYGIFALDAVSYVAALAAVVAVRLPRPPGSEEGRRARGSILTEATFGFRWVRRRPGLLGLMLVMAVIHFNLGMVQTLYTPLVLGFADARALGTVNSIGGIGVIAGSGLLMVWRGPRRRIHGILCFLLVQGLVLLLGAAQPSVVLAAAGSFGVLFTLPPIYAWAQTIWQRKTPADLQGRVLAARMMVAQAAAVLASPLAGPLADRIFEPAMSRDGFFAASIGRVLGTGPGRGVALFLVTLGALAIATVAVAFVLPRVRRVELDVPDAAAPLPLLEASTRLTPS